MSDQRPRRPSPPRGHGGAPDEPGEPVYPIPSDAERRSLSPRDPLRKERAADGGTRSRGEAKKSAGTRRKKGSREREAE